MPPPWRILFVDLAPSPGGSVVSLLCLLKGLDRGRYQPVVALSVHNQAIEAFQELGVEVVALRGYRHGTPEFAPPVQRLRAGTIGRWVQQAGLLLKVWRAGGLGLRLMQQVFPEARQIVQAIRRTHSDLVHLNNILPLNRAGILAALWTGRPCVCHVRGLDPLQPIDRRLARRVRFFIYISQAVQQAQEAEGALAPGQVVYNGVDLTGFESPMARETLLREFGLPSDGRIFGMVGRLEPWKGHPVFLRALARLRERHPEACGLVVGGLETNSPGYAEELQSLAVRLGLEGRVVFAGHRTDALRLMTGMDALVHCSVTPEPFGRVIIEGMAAERPVIGSAAGAVPEVIQDEVNGLLTPPGDAEALAGAMARVLTEPALARRLAEAGRKTVLERFTVEKHASEIQSIYEKVLGSPRPIQTVLR
ncbi:MAG: glycosyltransferase family 4 protein [Anaerolineae bacterium]